MKDPSDTYIAKEEAPVRKPLELYKIWSATTAWHYTNGDVAVDFNDGTEAIPDIHTYEPATIGRGSTEYNASLDVTTLKIQFSGISEPAVQYIAQNPIDIIWIEISRLFRDQNPLEKSVIFIGQIKTVSFKGVSAEAECVGFEHFLKMPIPLWRYQTNCNHKLFDAGCIAGWTLTKEDFKVGPASVTLDATKTILTSATFAGYAAGYFVGGLVEFETEWRTIVAYSGNTITLNFKMIGLEGGAEDDVYVYPGCDGRIETCRDKFASSNIDNFLGFPFIPDENPATRMP
jgi:uncharacterized phage protein (TIGR02218 family)